MKGKAGNYMVGRRCTVIQSFNVTRKETRFESLKLCSKTNYFTLEKKTFFVDKKSVICVSNCHLLNPIMCVYVLCITCTRFVIMIIFYYVILLYENNGLLSTYVSGCLDMSVYFLFSDSSVGWLRKT